MRQNRAVSALHHRLKSKSRVNSDGQECGVCVASTWLSTFVDYLKNVSSLALAWIACPRALITIKLESRLLLSRDAPRRAEGARAQYVIVIWYGLALHASGITAGCSACCSLLWPSRFVFSFLSSQTVTLQLLRSTHMLCFSKLWEIAGCITNIL